MRGNAECAGSAKDEYKRPMQGRTEQDPHGQTAFAVAAMSIAGRERELMAVTVRLD